MNARLENLRRALNDGELDGILVARPENRRYLSGFTGTTAVLLVTHADAVLFTDFRYVDQAKQQCPDFTIVDDKKSPTEALVRWISATAVKNVGFEADYLTYDEVIQLKEVSQSVPVLTWHPTRGWMERLRMMKDDLEISNIQHAAGIADRAFSHILTYLRAGLTEKQVALELETFMRHQGASGPAFDTIVASGWRSSLPHGVASDKVIEVGDFVKFDFGAVYQGYCSDLTRTVVIGNPDDKQREIYKRVLEAQLRALSAAKPGMTGRELDAVARDYFVSLGCAEAFGHSLGHGLGLAIHEDPRISMTGEQVLQAGMVITIEPGLYLPQWGGVRIEDDILLTDDGCRILTEAPKTELIQV